MNTNREDGDIYASLLLRGKDLDPRRITAILGIDPTWTFKRGDPKGKDQIWPSGLWWLDTKNSVQSVDISDHIK